MLVTGFGVKFVFHLQNDKISTSITKRYELALVLGFKRIITNLKAKTFVSSSLLAFGINNNK